MAIELQDKFYSSSATLFTIFFLQFKKKNPYLGHDQWKPPEDFQV